MPAAKLKISLVGNLLQNDGKGDVVPLVVLRLSAMLWCILVSLAADAGEAFPRGEFPQAYRNSNVAASATVWYCASSGHSSILCRLGSTGAEASPPQSARNSQLPVAARKIIDDPDRLAGWRVEIPLLAPPFDFELVGQLAEYVMCGNREACGVIFGETLAQLDQLVRQHEAQVLAGSQISLRASAL